ncbi:ubiquitin/ISG15-conjugating enzyme E2 L6 isoform X1 [Alexandromys fortis]|uniref:ubiquitin/ISG15-conjugating enzyme E2 L6 isoform X1 n=2 Tax=Alexandromys fortis TaxID=100897 RepID=UPI0021520A63|nr:ubiquitin/ISG15-conjugating enzyme E2 L6 isoform X1 [Microtus fortis]
MLNAYFVRAQCQAAGGRKGTKIVFLLSFRFLLGPCLSTIWKNGKGVVSLGPSRGLKGAAVGDPSGETLELEDLLEQLPPYLRDLSSNDDNVLVWNMLLLPEQPPYNLKAFRLRIDFPRDYPLKPPTLKFITKIYHPNVREDGLVCLPLISIRNWKPHTKTYQVLEALIVLVGKPNPEEPVRLELVELLIQNPEMFKRNAEEFTLMFGEDRPS